VPRAISVSQLTIRDDVILIGDLVAKATTVVHSCISAQIRQGADRDQQRWEKHN
jgi:hypothetical protein